MHSYLQGQAEENVPIRQVAMNDSARLAETVDRSCQFITTLPTSTLAEQDWGPKEVLAHLVYHHELHVNLVEAFLAGTPVAPPKGSFRALNTEAVRASRGIAPAELVDRLQRANQRLVEMYQQNNPSKITVEIKAGAKLRTLAELVPEVEAHIRKHLEKLRKASQAGA
jgi:ABC-type hemin transport system substrate-binding protein